MFVIPVYIFVLFFFWIVNISVFKRNLNYTNIFLILWCVIPALSSIGLFGFYTPPFEVHLYVWLAILTFEYVTILFRRIRLIHGLPQRRIGDIPSSSEINWRLMRILCFVSFIILIPFFLKSFRYALSVSFNSLRNKILTNEMYSARERIIIQDVLQPVLLVTTLSCFTYLIETGKLRFETIISILSCGMYMLTLGNRSLIMMVVLMLGVLLIEKYSLNVAAIFKKNKWVMRISILLIGGMIFMTLQRSIRGSTGLIYDVYSYFVGSFHLLGVAVSHPEAFALADSDYLMGAQLFNSVLDLINYPGLALGHDEIVQGGSMIINEVIQRYYFVSPTTLMNNNVTMLYGFLRDFGVMGIIIDTSVMALLYMIIYKARNKTIYHRMLYIFNVSLLPLFIIDWFYGRTFVLMTGLLLLALGGIDGKIKVRIRK